MMLHCFMKSRISGWSTTPPWFSTKRQKRFALSDVMLADQNKITSTRGAHTCNVISDGSKYKLPCIKKITRRFVVEVYGMIHYYSLSSQIPFVKMIDSRSYKVFSLLLCLSNQIYHQIHSSILRFDKANIST
jgi:hypothetical protein